MKRVQTRDECMHKLPEAGEAERGQCSDLLVMTAHLNARVI